MRPTGGEGGVRGLVCSRICEVSVKTQKREENTEKIGIKPKTLASESRELIKKRLKKVRWPRSTKSRKLVFREDLGWRGKGESWRKRGIKGEMERRKRGESACRMSAKSEGDDIYEASRRALIQNTQGTARVREKVGRAQRRIFFKILAK